jgi:hypothetical protein
LLRKVRNKNPPTKVGRSQIDHITPIAQFCKYDAEGVFQLLNSHHQEPNFDHVVETGKQSALEESEEPEFEPKEGTMTVFEFY